MKVLQASLLAATAASGIADRWSAKASDLAVRILTWNVRYASDPPSTGEKPWATRRPKMFSALNFEAAGQPETLFCFQEALQKQLLDLQADLGSEWSHFGVGRDDGAAKGEFNPIFWRPSAWQLEKNRTYWLSTTPDVPSRGWDADLNRIVTVAQFRHVGSGAPFVFMCTHFDHKGQTAREESAKLIVKITNEWQAATSEENNKSTPVFLGGDLNSQVDNPAYKTLVAPGNLHDTKDVVPKTKWHGNTNTFTGFTDSVSDDTRIDHIFVKDPAGIAFLSYGVLQNKFDDGVYISDHRPVVVDVRL